MIVVAGEALMDLTPHEVDGVSGYVPHPGGSPYNVAVGLGRLGVPVAFLGRISTDRFGRLLREHLADSGVSLDLVVAAPELTTLAFVHVGPGEPEYSFYAERTADRLLSPDDIRELPADASLHVGSISLVLEPGATTLEQLLQRESGRRLISLDPNVRPGLIDDPEAYRRRLEGWIELVDVVKISQADLAWLHPGIDPAEAADRWLDAGAALVLVTGGEAWSRAFTAGASATAVPPQVSVVDTVGAGDAFTSGALTHLHDHGWLTPDAVAGLTADELDALLADANDIAADTCTRPGADPPQRGRGAR